MHIQTKFNTFWKVYPRKKSKGFAEKAFAKINPGKELLAIMLASIERAKNSADWQKDGGQYIPYPATWLNSRCWEDEITEKVGKPTNQDFMKGVTIIDGASRER